MPFDEDPVFDVVGLVQEGQLVRVDGVTDMVLANLGTLADWSAWLPFAEALEIAPKDSRRRKMRDHLVMVMAPLSGTRGADRAHR